MTQAGLSLSPIAPEPWQEGVAQPVLDWITGIAWKAPISTMLKGHKDTDLPCPKAHPTQPCPPLLAPRLYSRADPVS